MASRAQNKQDRIFVKDGRRLYRRRFNATESRIGVIILIGLAAVVAWVAWKGAHPDPNLFMLETDLSQSGEIGEADRGPMPTDLAGPGWSEGRHAQFDSDNLYEKINGREGYYKSRGFQRLYTVTIAADENPQTVVDIELYDLGGAANALGAYAGERAAEAVPESRGAGFMHIDRNALYMTRGPYYLRAIGSDESPAVIQQLQHIAARFDTDDGDAELPWGYALFAGEMGMPPGQISYVAENAFSFGFATNVYVATLENGADLFVTPTNSEPAAAALAASFREGFLQHSDVEGDVLRDRYLDTYATVRAAGPWVVGIRRAPDAAAATNAVQNLAKVVREWPLPVEFSEPSVNGTVEEEYQDDGY